MRRATGDRRKHGLLGAAGIAFIGAILIATSWLLDVGTHDRNVRIVIGVALLLVAEPLAIVPWDRLSRRALVATPVLVLTALGVLGAVTADASQTFPALAVLTVVYLGLTQPPGATAAAVPALIADWWLANPVHSALVLARLPVMIAVMLLIGEGIARAQRLSRRETRALRAFAMTDPLTDLGNRRTLAIELAQLPVGGLVLFLDLDNFKDFNDRYGHSAGDLVLTQFALVARHEVREDDLVARFGGEEFVILVHGGASGHDVFERIRSAWAVTGGPVTFSGGMALRLRGERPETTLDRADRALYRAKLAGRDRLEVDVASAELDLERRARQARILDEEAARVQHALNQLRVVRQRQPAEAAAPSARSNTSARSRLGESNPGQPHYE